MKQERSASLVDNLQYRTVSVRGMERCTAVKDTFFQVDSWLFCIPDWH